LSRGKSCGNIFQWRHYQKENIQPEDREKEKPLR